MIQPIQRNDLPACLEIFHAGYETVAEAFGLTSENCPDRGRASLPFEKLRAEFENGAMMFGYYHNGKPVGFLGVKMRGDGVLKLDDIVVLPNFRNLGYGQKLMDYCKAKARELGSVKIQLGMMDENKRLKSWYEKNGFTTVGHTHYEGAPFTVGIMECPL